MSYWAVLNSGQAGASLNWDLFPINRIFRQARKEQTYDLGSEMTISIPYFSYTTVFDWSKT